MTSTLRVAALVASLLAAVIARGEERSVRVVVELHRLDEVARFAVAVDAVLDGRVPLDDIVEPVRHLVLLQDSRVRKTGRAFRGPVRYMVSKNPAPSKYALPST